MLIADEASYILNPISAYRTLQVIDPEAAAENHIANMVARVALGEKTAEDALAEAHERAETIFDQWRARGLVAGGAGQADG